jgi:hypothetical protein
MSESLSILEKHPEGQCAWREGAQWPAQARLSPHYQVMHQTRAFLSGGRNSIFILGMKGPPTGFEQRNNEVWLTFLADLSGSCAHASNVNTGEKGQIVVIVQAREGMLEWGQRVEKMVRSQK